MCYKNRFMHVQLCKLILETLQRDSVNGTYLSLKSKTFHKGIFMRKTWCYFVMALRSISPKTTKISLSFFSVECQCVQTLNFPKFGLLFVNLFSLLHPFYIRGPSKFLISPLSSYFSNFFSKFSVCWAFVSFTFAN